MIIQYIRPTFDPFHAAGLPRPRRGEETSAEVAAFCRHLRRLEQSLQAEADNLGLQRVKAVVGVFSPNDGRRGLTPERLIELSLSGVSPEELVLLREFQEKVNETVQKAVEAFCTARELLGG